MGETVVEHRDDWPAEEKRESYQKLRSPKQIKRPVDRLVRMVRLSLGSLLTQHVLAELHLVGLGGRLNDLPSCLSLTVGYQPTWGLGQEQPGNNSH